MKFLKLKAWREIIKMGASGKKMKQVNVFLKDNVITVLQEQGWKDFLIVPRTIEEFIDYFSYTDIAYLEDVLNTLEQDKVISRLKDGSFELNNGLSPNGLIPPFFSDSAVELLRNYSRAIPSRLKSKYGDFAPSFNLFNWDDWLANMVYEQIRRAAFAFTPEVFERPGVFLDAGCGNGWGTSAIWLYFYERGLLHPGTKFKLYGMDNSEDLVKIAEEEFELLTARREILTREEIKKNIAYFPKFKVGDVAKIPFENDSFDFIYMSQVLHWTNIEKTIDEVHRVLRPGGIFFGTNTMHPHINPYLDLHVRVIENAHGSFSKVEMTEWLKKAGFSKIKFATPITIFKCTRNP